MAILYSLLKIVLSLAIQAIMNKQDDIEGPGASKLRPDSINTASSEKSIPFFLGRVQYKGSNLIWYGDQSQESVYKEVSAGFIADLINGEQKVFVGYKYYLGMQVAIGYSIDDTPIELYSGFVDQDKFLFKETTPIQTSSYFIDEPDLFGGTKNLKDGWTGTFDYYDGTQLTTNSYMEQQIGASETPVFKNLAHIVFNKNYIGNRPNPKPITFELKHKPVPSWGNSTEASIGEDYNPIYALWYVMTDKTIGAGIDPLLINTTNFSEAAAIVKSEGIGISLSAENQIVFSDFQRTLEDVVAGLLSVNTKTGLYEIKLNRDDYVFEELTQLTESDISQFNWEKPTTESLMSEVKVSFENRNNNYKKDIAIYSDLGVRYNRQSAKSTTLNFDWIKDPLVASKIAGRELKTLSYPLTKGSFITSLKNIDLNRGDVIRIKYAPDEIDIPVRILSIDYGLLEDNKIRVDFAEDFFGRFDANFEAPPQTKFTEPNKTALDVNSYYVEAPYFFNKEFIGSNFIIIAEQPEPSNFEYDLHIDLNGSYQNIDSSTFSPTADLNNSVDLNDNSVVIKNGLLIERLRNHNINEIKQGNNLFVMQNGTDTEWMAFETVTDNGDGTYTLNSVKRGIFHTKIKEFPIDSKILFITYGNTYIKSLIDGSVNYKLLSRTITETLDLNSATTVNASENRLNSNSYPLINVKINGNYFPATAPSAGFDITWEFPDKDKINFFTDNGITFSNSSGNGCLLEIFEDGISVGTEFLSVNSYSYTPSAGVSTVRITLKYIDILKSQNLGEFYDITVNLV